MATKLYALFLICACALVPSATVAEIPPFTGGCGDVNGDGNVQVQDIILTVQLLLNGGHHEQADVNNDSNINVQDILKMVDWLLNPGTGPSCHGCTIEEACNYDRAKTVLVEGSCTMPDPDYRDCFGACLNDEDNDGICDEEDVEGCRDETACNYAPSATTDCADCCKLPGVYACDDVTCVNDSDEDEVCDEDEISGCDDDAACNRDPLATDNDGSCAYPDQYYDCDDNCLNDIDDDGVCNELELGGCVYSHACNYNEDATDDDGSCLYADTFKHCDGSCISDVDEDGVCAEYEVLGCTYPTACNFDETATEDDGDCNFPEVNHDCYGDCLADVDGDEVCDGDEVLGCVDSAACNRDSSATEDDGSCFYAQPPRDCFEACVNDEDEDDVCDEDEVDGCTDETACNYDPAATDEDSSCLYRGDFAPHFSENRLCDNTCEHDVDEDNVCDEEEKFGCLDDRACNYNQREDGETITQHNQTTCQMPALNNDCDGNCILDLDNDGVCDHQEVEGCTNATACNYDDQATNNDGSCTYAPPHRNCNLICFNDDDDDDTCDEDEKLGCMDPLMCNYDPEVTDHDYSLCEGPALYHECDGSCSNDLDGDEVCDEDEVLGCTDEEACNFDEDATDDDGGCEHPPPRYNCTGKCAPGFKRDCSGDGDCCSEAWLHDDYADCKDQKWGCDLSCFPEEKEECRKDGCMEEGACNYDWLATEQITAVCRFAQEHYDCHDKCLHDEDHDDVCDELEIEGCMDNGACNYDDTATDNVGCIYKTLYYHCDNTCVNDADGDLVCDENEILGCKRPDACNYSPLATDDDGSCHYALLYYSCAGECLIDSDGDLVCDENEVQGCEDGNACNYNPLATDGVADENDPNACRYAEPLLDCFGVCLSDEDGDGFCDEHEIVGCRTYGACNHVPHATDDGPCLFPPEDYLECPLPDETEFRCKHDTDGDGVCDEVEIVGCRHEDGCNYNADATEDPTEGSEEECTFPEVFYSCAGTCLLDDDGDGVCDELEIPGCGDPEACGDADFIASVTDHIQDECTYAETFYDCNGNCLYDEDHDHVCDQFEVAGCRDLANACNPNPDATDDATEAPLKCWYPEYGQDCDGSCADGYVEDCAQNGLCCDTTWLDDGTCDLGHGVMGCDLSCYAEEVADCSGCLDPDACNTEEGKKFDGGNCEYPLTPFHSCHGGRCLKDYLPDCTDTAGRCCHNSMLGNGICHSGQQDQGGCDLSCYDNDAGDCVGCTDGTGTDYPYDGEVYGGCNYNEHMTANAMPPHPETCLYPLQHYDCNGECRADQDGDGVCDDLELVACQKEDACNYDATATDPSPLQDGQLENMDEEGWEATYGCLYPNEDWLDCNGDCLVDIDQDGVCDDVEVEGCMDEYGEKNPLEQNKPPCNFDPLATNDNGHYCDYPELYLDCVGECSEDEDNNGICDQVETYGCMDVNGNNNFNEPGRGACNYDMMATRDDGTCEYPERHYDCFGLCVDDADNDRVCDGLEIEGCQNPKACNYNENATDHTFDEALKCVLPEQTKDCEGNCADGFVRDCSVDDVCCLASFIDDAVPDCRDRKWGCDLTCYNNDGGACQKDGCTDDTACNFDYLATDDDLSCRYPPDYYDCDSNCLIDTDEDGVCEELEVKGCRVEVACNYNEYATDAPLEGHECEYKEDRYVDGLHDCDGKCLADHDGDEVCDDYELNGCTDPLACNFDVTATEDDGSCLYAPEPYTCCRVPSWTVCEGDTDTPAQVCENHDDHNLFHNPRHCCTETSTDRCDTDDNFARLLEEADSHGNVYGFACQIDTDGDGVCDSLEGKGCKSDGACNIDDSATDSVVELCIFPQHFPNNLRDCDDHCYEDADGDNVCDGDEIDGCTDQLACNTDPDATDNDGSCEYAVQYRDCHVPNNGACVDGLCHGVCLHDIDGDDVCDEQEIQGCTLTEACNFNADATDNLMEVCDLPDLGLTCDGQCISDSDGDGVCDELEVPGCTMADACNWDADATELDVQACNFPPVHLDCDGNCLDDEDDDGVCDQNEVFGCDGRVHPTACNKDADSTQDDGSCSFAPQYRDCDSVCLNDADGDLICDENEEMGCQDHLSCTYNADATDHDDGLCRYPSETYLDCDANCLHDTDGDGVCNEIEVLGCGAADACNYDDKATESDDSCWFAETNYDCDHFCINDADSDGVCDEEEIHGCLLPDACNYDASATEHQYDDCVFAEEYFDCDGNCLYDSNHDGTCDHQEVPGCNLVLACNHDPRATQYDGSCEFPAPYYDCDENCLNDRDTDGVCDELETRGCMEADACNIDPTATDEDGSCEFAETYYDCDSVCLKDEDEDGVCDELETVGCMKWDACNYDDTATDPIDLPDGLQKDFDHDVGCKYPDETYVDCDGNCLSDEDGDLVCEEVEVPGCKDETGRACNIAHQATEHDESMCEYPPEEYLGCPVYGSPDEYPCLHDTDEDDVCDEIEVIGCTDSASCNFDPLATDDHGCINDPTNYKCDPEGDLCLGDGQVCFSCINDRDGDLVCDEVEVVGCQDTQSCNYDDLATDEGGFCRYPSVAHRDCDNECLHDYDNDEVCDEDEVVGCTKMNACNYNRLATDDTDDPAHSGFCTYAPAYRNCHGVCNSDTDQDGVCDGEENAGCKDPDACNADDAFTDADNSQCQYPEEHYTCDGCINDADDDGVCDELEVLGCPANEFPEACNGSEDATEDDGSCEFPSENKQCNGSCKEGFIEDCTQDKCCAESWLGWPYKDCKDRAYGCDLSCHDYDNGACIKHGCNRETACNFDPLVTHQEPNSCLWPEEYRHCDGSCINDEDANGVCDELEYGCKIENACNYNADAVHADNTKCEFPEELYKRCDGTCINDGDADGVCDEDEVLGCDDNTACNFSEEVTENDGSCEPPPQYRTCDDDCILDEDGNGICDEEEHWGCALPGACNYDRTGTITKIDNSLCVYPEPLRDCDGVCLIDTDGDGVCNGEEIVGCTDNKACNFDPEVTEPDNALCTYEDSCKGCTDPDSCNYNPLALARFDTGDICNPIIPNRACAADGGYGACDEGYLDDCSGDFRCVREEYLNDAYPDCGPGSGGGSTWDLSCHGEEGCN